MRTDPTLAASYQFCGEIARREARNFYFAFRLLPRDRRQSMYALYAFMRQTDDLADDPGTRRREGSGARAVADELDAATRGRAGGSWPGLPALADTVSRCGIPPSLLHEVIDGVSMDVQPRPYRELRRAGRLLLPRRLGRRALLHSHLGLPIRRRAGPSGWRRLAASRCSSPTSSATSARMRATGGSTFPGRDGQVRRRTARSRRRPPCRPAPRSARLRGTARLRRITTRPRTWCRWSTRSAGPCS